MSLFVTECVCRYVGSVSGSDLKKHTVYVFCFLRSERSMEFALELEETLPKYGAVYTLLWKKDSEDGPFRVVNEYVPEARKK